MHYLPFGARLNKGILMVTQLTSGFHGLHLFCSPFMAEKERFELSNPVKGYTISNRARSTNYATSPCLLK